MATAKIETVTKTVEKEVEEKVYVLTLSEEEAKTLRALTGAIVGNVAGTYNKHTYAIWNTLLDAGVPWTVFVQRFRIEAGDLYAKSV